jgi:putative photosynthetic complex assembly protein
MSDKPMTEAQRRHPQLVNRDKEMIPPVLLKAMAILALSSLAITSYAVITDRPLVGQPLPSEEIRSRMIVLDGDKYGAVEVRAADGAVMADLGPNEAGFISVIWRGMNRTRMQHGVAETLPLRLVEFENGRLAIFDDETGWSVELASFGDANRASFAALFDK